MSFDWIPDAELDPHPRLTWLVECGFDLTVLAFYRRQVILPENYKFAPGTLVISNHQNDADVPILTTVLCQRRGLHIRWPLPFFASREDFFARGFLASLLHTWPRPLRWLLSGISLGGFFRIVRSAPMRRVREFTLAEAWRDLPESFAAEQSLNERGRREFREAAHSYSQPVARRFWGLRRLQREARAALYPHFRATIDAQLKRFAALLDAGRMVYFAPEGTLSEDGCLRRVRGGLLRIVRLSAAPPPILPVALSYDPLAPGRRRVIARVGRALDTYNAQEIAGFNAWVEMSIRKLYPVNASHLLSRFLVTGPQSFTTEALAHWFGRARAQLVETGCTLDPTLDCKDLTVLAARRLAWLKRKGLVARTASGWSNLWPRDSRPGWRQPAKIVCFFANALDDHLRALAPGVEINP